ncbi:MAG: hypothetical protein ABL999_16920 [Pyrinomonadaceae bacterium]
MTVHMPLEVISLLFDRASFRRFRLLMQILGSTVFLIVANSTSYSQRPPPVEQPRFATRESCKAFSNAVAAYKSAISQKHTDCLDAHSGQKYEGNGGTCSRRACQLFHMDGDLKRYIDELDERVSACNDLVSKAEERQREADRQHRAAALRQREADEERQRLLDEANRAQKEAQQKQQRENEKAAQSAAAEQQRQRNENERRQREAEDRRLAAIAAAQREKEQREAEQKAVFEAQKDQILQKDADIKEQIRNEVERNRGKEFEDRSVVNATSEADKIGLDSSKSPLGLGSDETGSMSGTPTSIGTSFTTLKRSIQDAIERKTDSVRETFDRWNEEYQRARNELNEFTQGQRISSVGVLREMLLRRMIDARSSDPGNSNQSRQQIELETRFDYVTRYGLAETVAKYGISVRAVRGWYREQIFPLFERAMGLASEEDNDKH